MSTTLLSLFFLAAPAEPPVTRYDDMLVYQDPGKAAVKADAVLWEDGVLPLVFDANINPQERAELLGACQDWSAVANVRCQEGEYKGRHITVMKHEGLGCFSLWGMGTSFLVLERLMNLASGCWYHSILIHELGHALGLIHEHQRPDRDFYITVHPENVNGMFLGLNTTVNFKPQAAQIKTPYDFTSIMHYDRKAFSKNFKDTMVPKAAYMQYIDVMGNVDQVSQYDAQAVAELYGR
jgi:hypothetical protein